MATPRVALNEEGDLALITDDGFISGEPAVASITVDLDGQSLVEADLLEGLEAVSDVHFAPGDKVALAANYFGDGVYIIGVGADGNLEQKRVLKGIGLAGGMDLVRTGPQAGMFLVPAVSPKQGVGTLIARIRVNQSEDVEMLEPFVLGEGTENMIASLAIQP